MMPIGPLMIEHRLIERMISLMDHDLRRMQQGGRVNSGFVDTAVRFIRVYADQCHHGKEEDILFRELGKKPLSEEHQRILDELVQEHQWGRETTQALSEANDRHKKGDQEAVSSIIDNIQKLIDFYPGHIEKEDKHFFLPVMEYFSDQEKDGMLEEGRTFDSDLFHRDYADRISVLEQNEEPEGE